MPTTSNQFENPPEPKQLDPAQEIRHTREEVSVDRSSDSYRDLDGRTVFTAAFHLKRGYCCGNGCRHCPYDGERYCRVPRVNSK